MKLRLATNIAADILESLTEVRCDDDSTTMPEEQGTNRVECGAFGDGAKAANSPSPSDLDKFGALDSHSCSDDCTCALRALVRGSLVTSHGYTEPEAEEILSDLLSRHGNFVGLHDAESLARGILEGLTGKSCDDRLTALKLQRDREPVYFNLQPEALGKQTACKDTVLKHLRNVEQTTETSTPIEATENFRLPPCMCSISEAVMMASDFVGVLEGAMVDLPHGYHDFLGNIKARTQSLGEPWICSTDFDLDTRRFAIEIRPAKPAEEDGGDLEDVSNE